MKRVFVLLALVCTLLVPSVARADPLDSFARGLSDLSGNGTNEQVTPEQDFIDSYEPRLLGESGTGVTEYEEGDNVGPINSVIDRVNHVQIGNSNSTLQNGVRWLLQSTVEGQQFVALVAGIVFFWWGLRKSKQMVMTAFRSGRLSFGDRKVRDRNSYYYGTRPSDWR